MSRDAKSDGADPLVAVVVVTWNGAHLLADCLASLRAQTLTRSSIQVIVVDNASEDGTAELLAREHQDVEVVVSDRNLGFAGGANIGLRRLTTPYAVVLNNDAVAEPGMLAALVNALTAPGAEDAGAITAKVLLAKSGKINSTGNLVSRSGRGYDRDWQRPAEHGRPAGEVFGFCGAAAALRMSALAEVGLFDEDLFLYYEDTDLSWRLRAAGWKVLYEPRAVAHHRHASTSVAGSPRFHFWNERNSLVVLTRHAPAHLVVAMLLRRTVGLLVHTVRGAPAAETRARWTAFGAYIRRLPRTLAERHGTWHGARRTRAEVAAGLTARAGADD